MVFGKMFLREIAGSLLSEQDSAILPTRVASHSAGFGSSCPLTELAIYKLGYLKDSNAATHSVHRDILQ